MFAITPKADIASRATYCIAHEQHHVRVMSAYSCYLFGSQKLPSMPWSGERLMDSLVAHLNIEHYRKALANEFDETKRKTLIRLIGEKELKLAEAAQKEDGEKQRGPHHPSNAAATQSKARLFGLQLRPSFNEGTSVR